MGGSLLPPLGVKVLKLSFLYVRRVAIRNGLPVEIMEPNSLQKCMKKLHGNLSEMLYCLLTSYGSAYLLGVAFNFQILYFQLVLL